MRTVTLLPSHLGMHAGEHNGRPVGVLTLAGSGEFADVVLEVMIDQPALGQLEAETGNTRTLLRTAGV